jgi:apolipoprotein N-acyltransferase
VSPVKGLLIRSTLTRLARLIVPPDIEVRKRRLELTIWSFLLSLSFYPGPLGFLAWLSLVRPAIILSRLHGREAFNAAYFFGFFFNAFSLYWVVQVTPPGILAAVIIVAFYYAAVLSLFVRLYHVRPFLGIWSLPFLWVGMEYFRTLSQFAFPWSDLGYSQSYYLYILQIVSVISVHGLSFLIVIANVLLWQVLRKEVSLGYRFLSFWGAVGIVIVLVSYGWIMIPRFPAPGTIPVAVLQGSVPIEDKWQAGNEDYSFVLYDSLARSVIDSGVKLYVWPETAAPAYLSYDLRRRALIAKTAVATRAYHLVGALGTSEVDGRQRYFNSAYLFDPTGRMTTRYDKVKLVPFTEQVPYQDHMPFLRREFLMQYLTFIETYNVRWWADFKPGDSAKVNEMGELRFGTLICFESTFPEYCRQMIRQGADFIVGITNDTWFGESVGIHQHSRMFITRAVENRCWMVRAANSGLSYIVDDYGRIRSELPVYTVAALCGAVRPIESFSVFTRIGDVVGLVSFLFTITIAVILVLRWVIRRLGTSRGSRTP